MIWAHVTAEFEVGDKVLVTYRADDVRSCTITKIITSRPETADDGLARYTVEQDDGMVWSPVHPQYICHAHVEEEDEP